MTEETVIAGGLPIESPEYLSARKKFQHDCYVRGSEFVLTTFEPVMKCRQPIARQ